MKSRKKVKDILLEYLFIYQSHLISEIEDSGVSSVISDDDPTNKLILIPSVFLDKEVLDIPKFLKKDSKNVGISMMIDSDDIPIYFIFLYEDNSVYVSYFPNEIIIQKNIKIGGLNVKEILEERFDLSIHPSITNLIYDKSVKYEFNKLNRTITKYDKIICYVLPDNTLHFISSEDKQIVNDLWKRGKLYN
jgi:hypothetical protein